MWMYDGQYKPPVAPTAPSGGGTDSTLQQYGNQYGVPIGPGMTPGAAPQYNTEDPIIYIGTLKRDPASKYGTIRSAEYGVAMGLVGEDIDQTTQLSAMMADFERQNIADQKRMATLLAIGGYAGAVDLANVGAWVAGASYLDVLDAYRALLEDAASRTAIGQRLTPDDLLKTAVEFRLKAAGLAPEDISDVFSGSYADQGNMPAEDLSRKVTTTTRSVNFMDPMDAKGLVRGLLQQELGRDPTQGEYEDFISAIHAAEKRNPSTTRTTYTYNSEGDMTNQSSVTQGGLAGDGLDQILYEKARRNPNWAIWQAVGTYAPALMASLGATVPGAGD